ncbi:hypothetical protein HPB49_008490 [Dermacentor silvarum]|uniref:Uncharacterized protein n=1 Tax=Dermacentor silvarum TaxID=543639 RepID=A0ACB8DB77_DERSI|nr:hypothetical protein HPB49_008490 [Dermacentor silvarum]
MRSYTMHIAPRRQRFANIGACRSNEASDKKTLCSDQLRSPTVVFRPDPGCSPKTPNVGVLRHSSSPVSSLAVSRAPIIVACTRYVVIKLVFPSSALWAAGVALYLTRCHVARDPLEPGERLAIALSYLASGQEIPSIALAYRVGIETARLCIHLSCRTLWARLKDHVMKTPTTADWAHVAEGFASRWQFPNCLGAVDGKHVAVVYPRKSGSTYFNYKAKAHGTFSIVLMAVVDSECKYMLIYVGAEGRLSDGGTFKNSGFGRALTHGQLDIPSLGRLPGTSTNAPYVFVGDEAFQLRKDFMRPFPARHLSDEKRIFNYRLSRARRCVENAFGITAARWRVLLRTINLQPENVDFVVKAACVLHNFLTIYNPQAHQFPDREDSYGNVVAGNWRQTMQGATGNGFFLFGRYTQGTTTWMQLLPGTCSLTTSGAVLARCLGSGTNQECPRRQL